MGTFDYLSESKAWDERTRSKHCDFGIIWHVCAERRVRRSADLSTEDEPGWALEVVIKDGSTIVWDEQFATDDAAHAEFLRIVKKEGMSAFEDDSNVIPFRRR